MNKDIPYNVPMTENEMQMVANALAGFYRMCTNEKLNVDLTQTVSLLKVLERFKLILNAPNEDQSSAPVGSLTGDSAPCDGNPGMDLINN